MILYRQLKNKDFMKMSENFKPCNKSNVEQKEKEKKASSVLL